MRAFVGYIMRGRLHAALIATTTAILSLLLPPLNYLSAAVIGLVTLRKGWLEGLLVMAASGAAFEAFSAAVRISPLVGMLLAVLAWVPVWGLGVLLRYTVSLPLTVMTGAAVAAAIVAVVYVILPDPAQSWNNVFQALAQARDTEPQSVEVLGRMLRGAAPYMTGLLVGMMYLGLMASLLLSRWWQALLYNPGGFRREFHALRLGKGFGIATVAVLAGGILLSGPMAQAAVNVLFVLVAAYTIHGLGLVHGILAARKAHVGWLVLLYVLSMVILPQLAVVLALAALVDSFADFRSRYTGPRGVG